MQTTAASLRERQRLEAWSAIHDAAAGLVLENGWSSTTVEMIASDAGISNRTFFNYFQSKEDAVLGIGPLTIPEDALRAFHTHDDDLLVRTVQLMTAVMRSATPEGVRSERRLTLIRTVPELRSRLSHVSASAENLVEPIVAEEFSRDQATRHPQDPHDSAKALLMLAGTVIRFAHVKDPAAMSDRSSASLTTAITTFREAIKASL